MIETNALTTSPDFKRLSPALSKEYLKHLEESILQHGCLDPVHIWKNQIIDGHKRFLICTNHHIPLEVINHSFSCKAEAVVWACTEHMKCASITPAMSIYLIGKHYEGAKDCYLFEHRREINSSNQQPKYKYRVAAEIGNIYHMNGSTIYKYGMYAKNIDLIFEKNEALANYILSGRLRFAHKTASIVANLNKSVLEEIEAQVRENHLNHISSSELERIKLRSSVISNKRISKLITGVEHTIGIKQDPAYDSDAEISSLSLTIPSWISTIKRSCANTDFSAITDDGRKQLTLQLTLLEESIKEILEHLEEL
ncbi:MAG: hypothetical protein Q4B26_16295 [Eubacteriales bacterium]|nr:hypothetical protein [Eubacteriales bacterium]